MQNKRKDGAIRDLHLPLSVDILATYSSLCSMLADVRRSTLTTCKHATICKHV